MTRLEKLERKAANREQLLRLFWLLVFIIGFSGAIYLQYYLTSN